MEKTKTILTPEARKEIERVLIDIFKQSSREQQLQMLQLVQKYSHPVARERAVS